MRSIALASGMRTGEGTGGRKVVFFDSGCVLCSGVVRWCHARDRRGSIWFAALESDYAAEHRKALGLPEAGAGAETFALYDEATQQVFFRFDGVRYLMKELGGGWRMAGKLAGWVPLAWGNASYDFVARHRRQWFGENKECTLPPNSLRGRVLS